jgi:GNAT superfamily N-acetyltransferase
MKIDIRLVTGHNFPQLQVYHGDLSAETKQRFAPHGFGQEALSEFYSNTINQGFIATCNDEVIAYAVLRLSFLPYDAERFLSYGFKMNDRVDATYAPSVAEAWQGQGVAAQMLTFIRNVAGNMDAPASSYGVAFRQIIYGPCSSIANRDSSK